MAWWDQAISGGDVDWNVVYAAQLAKNQAAAAQAERDRIAALPPPAPTPAPTPPPAPTPIPTPPPAAAFDATPYRNTVDTGFSMFTPEFYANKYQAAYSPVQQQLSTQFSTASDFLKSGLAKRGLLNSNVGRGVFSTLDALRGQTDNTAKQDAQKFQTDLTGQVGGAKDTLYGSIGEGKDNASIGTRTKAETDRLAGINPETKTLGDVFSSTISPYASSLNQGAQNPEDRAFATGGGLNLAGGGGLAASAKVVSDKKKKV